ncbi:MAG: YlxM family DNA-binding protein [Anaerovoracaceae bacterium]|jgi:predicted DNA-binding protein YlxM (UPF0122 family)
MLEKIVKTSILFDFYGELLPEKQREIFRLYHEDNYSLGEIGIEYGITRQGVHEAVKRSEEKLQNYEKKLGLVKKFQDTETVLDKIKDSIEELIYKFKENQELTMSLEEIKKVILKINQ